MPPKPIKLLESTEAPHFVFYNYVYSFTFYRSLCYWGNYSLETKSAAVEVLAEELQNIKTGAPHAESCCYQSSIHPAGVSRKEHELRCTILSQMYWSVSSTGGCFVWVYHNTDMRDGDSVCVPHL